MSESERQRREDQLRLAQKMEAVGRLAGGIAHDMNNILAAVLSYAEFLTDSLADGDPRRHDAEEIRNAALRGATLTRQLLAFSRQQVLQPRLIDVNELVAGLLEAPRAVVGERIEVATELDPHLPRVHVDPEHLEQAIVNLAVNAADAMPEGGRLRVRTALEDGRVVIEVTDTGAGMDCGTLERVFEPFFTTKAHSRGSGMGLATVFGIVKQSGGDIQVESEPGRGTTFRIELPAGSEPPHAERGASLRTRGAPAKESVLLVEDDDSLRPALVRSLRTRGYRVVEATSGPEAIAAADGGAGVRFDLLVTDVVLPGASGTDVSRQLRARHPTLKVLFISGYADRAAQDEGVLSGACAFLQKPFAPEMFVAKVRAVLDGAP